MAFDLVRGDTVGNRGDGSLDAARALVFERQMWVGGEVRDVRYRVSVGADISLHNAACSLLNDRYAWRGYGSELGIPTGAHHTTFVTEMDDVVIGTLTLAIDSNEGLAIDRSFPQTALLARSGSAARICELTRFAFDGGVRSKEVLAGLFHMVFIYGTIISDCTDLFIEVLPRHAGFYEHMLGFKTVGEPGVNLAVGAPSQLMGLGVDTIRRQIAELAGTAAKSSTRSLYPYFFPTAQELQIRAALALHAHHCAASNHEAREGRDRAAGMTKGRAAVARIGSGSDAGAGGPTRRPRDISVAA